MREQRATVEEQLAEAKKSLEALKKDIDSLTKKEKLTQVCIEEERGEKTKHSFFLSHSMLV